MEDDVIVVALLLTLPSSSIMAQWKMPLTLNPTQTVLMSDKNSSRAQKCN